MSYDHFKEKKKQSMFDEPPIETDGISSDVPSDHPKKHSALSHRSVARLASIHGLFCLEYFILYHGIQDPIDLLQHFIRETLEQGLVVDMEHNGSDRIYLYKEQLFFQELLTGAWRERELLDKNIACWLTEQWTLRTLDPVLKAILRVALFEWLHLKTPPGIVIHEFLLIVRCFWDTLEKVHFVHSVLDHAMKKKEAAQIASALS